MAEITAAMVKELRDKTSVGMMECKKALEEAEGIMEDAIRVLRERGIAKAAKREGRAAAEGLAAVAINPDCTEGTVAELNCETDFVSRNEEFAALVKQIAAQALADKPADLEALKGLTLEGGANVQTAVDDVRTKIGEKIELSTYARVSGDVVTGYVHPPGKIGVLLAADVEGGVADDKRTAVIEELRGIAMHIAAFSPRFLDESQVDNKTLDAEREIFAALARNEGKPEAIIPKIVDGKIKSFYKDNCLLDQAYAKDPSKTVVQVVEELSKAVGVKVKLTDFVRIQVGAKAEG
ncbi:translation elongation factor Ts [bacterium]|nr:translation elongation factor Ts [bacterium]